MGLFNGIKDSYKKSEAAIIVQNLFQHLQTSGLMPLLPSPFTPTALANQIVGVAWDTNPDVLSGKFGNRPHKLTVATYSLALCVDRMEKDKGGPLWDPVFLALGSALAEVQTNGSLYPFNQTDHFLLDKVSDIFGRVTENMV